MACLRRSKIFSPDSPTAQFLYTIIKQLDLKTVDWNEVASGLDITNGHAARMRFSRLKAQIEGLPTQSTKPRVPRPKKDGKTAGNGKGKSKPGYEPGKVDDLLKGEDDDGDVKMERDGGTGVKQETVVTVKQEPSLPEISNMIEQLSDTAKIKAEPGAMKESKTDEDNAASIKQEPTPEKQRQSLSPASGLAAVDLNVCSNSPLPLDIENFGFSPRPPMPGTMTFPHQLPFPAVPPRATVSLADLQLPPIPKATSQMPLPTYSYPLAPMSFDFDLDFDFDFDFNAPLPQPQYQSTWQPQFDTFRPVSVKREVMEG